jgi:ADP-ribose pyrophosphatase
MKAYISDVKEGITMDEKADLLSNMLRFNHEDVITHEIKTKHQGFFRLDEYHISHRLFDGGISQTLTREIFERGDAVVLITYDPALDKVVLLEQFRPGGLRHQQTPWMLEFVAGMFSKDESPIEVAIREAKEEANLTLNENDILPVMEYLSSPGGMSEKIHLYVGKVDSQLVQGVYGLPEEGEDILTHVVSREAALKLLIEGKISNAATIIGLQWLAMNFESLRDKWLNR